MSLVEKLAKSIRASETVDELDTFVSEYMSIEVEGSDNTLVISSGESEIRINKSRIELCKDSLLDSARIVIDSTGHLSFHDAYGNSLTLAEIQTYLNQIQQVKDNQEDGNPYNQGSTGGNTGGHVQNTDTGTTSSSFQLFSGNNGNRIVNTADNRGIAIRNAANTADTRLKSGSYFLGSDLYMMPIIDGQSAIGCYWGLQIGGLRSKDLFDSSYTPVEPTVGNIEARNSSSVIVSPTTTKGVDMPDSFSTLNVVKVDWQTGGFYQKWTRQNGTIDASLDLNSQMFVRSLTVGSENNPNNATINAVQSTAGRAVFNLQAPLGQTSASFLLRNSNNVAIIAFRGGNSAIGNGSGVGSPSGGAIALGDGVGGVENVVGLRQKGWVAPTGTATRGTFATSTVTTTQLAERVKALIDDLTTHGLIGT